ncbi:MAG: hypothetical protein JWN22_1532 [Nocardioides sp.]|nr:hypothetical protein [Nocardioides sp.]
MRSMRSQPRRLLALSMLLAVVGAATAATWTVLERDPPSVVDGVCRSLAEGHELAPVPGDVLSRAAETSDVRLRDLAEPSTAQMEASREELEREFVRYSSDVRAIDGFIACLVDYSRNGRPGDPDADPPLAPVTARDHVAALLLYSEREQPVNPCFGPRGACGDQETYPIDCAMFTDATTGRTLRVGGCWGFRNDSTDESR